MNWYRICLLLLACCLNAAPCFAQTFYVATDGEDAPGRGTLAAPFATIQYALYNAVEQSDDVHVRGGTYAWDDGTWIENEGTAEDYVSIQPYPGEHVVVDGANMPGSAFSIGGKYVEIKGFEVKNSPKTGITVWGGSHVSILDNVIHDSWKGGIWAGGPDDSTVTDILIKGNTVYHNCQMNADHVLDEGWPSGIGLGWPATNITVEQNTVYENHGEGIGLCCGKSHTVQGNTVYDNYSVGIYLDNTQNSVVQQNLVYTTMNEVYFRNGRPCNGIQVANEFYDETGEDDRSKNNSITGNIVLGVRYAFFYGAYQVGGGFIGSQVLHNTFHDPIEGVFFIEQDNHADSVIANNICTQPDGGDLLWSGSGLAGISLQNNLWHGGDPGDAAGPGDLQADPQFVRGTGLAAVGYKLRPGSPAVGAAEVSLSPALDFGQRSRDQAPDLGAWEQLPGDQPSTAPCWHLLLSNP